MLLSLPQQVYEPDNETLRQVKGQPPVWIWTQHLPRNRTGSTGLPLCRMPCACFTQWVYKESNRFGRGFFIFKMSETSFLIIFDFPFRRCTKWSQTMWLHRTVLLQHMSLERHRCHPSSCHPQLGVRTTQGNYYSHCLFWLLIKISVLFQGSNTNKYTVIPKKTSHLIAVILSSCFSKRVWCIVFKRVWEMSRHTETDVSLFSSTYSNPTIYLERRNQQWHTLKPQMKYECRTRTDRLPARHQLRKVQGLLVLHHSECFDLVIQCIKHL